MTEEEFKRITKRGNFVAWKNNIEPETTAIAYMTEDAWFVRAINCVRDGDMGAIDKDGVYERQWGYDGVWIEDEPRLATDTEVGLYLRKASTNALGFAEYFQDYELDMIVRFLTCLLIQSERQTDREKIIDALEWLNELCKKICGKPYFIIQ